MILVQIWLCFLCFQDSIGFKSLKFFLLSLIKIFTIRCKNAQKERKANVSATYGGPLQCHKFIV